MKITSFRRKIPESNRIIFLYSADHIKNTEIRVCKYTGRVYGSRGKNRYMVHVFKINDQITLHQSRNRLIYNYKGWRYPTENEMMAFL